MKRDRPPKGIRYFNLGPWPFYVGFTTSEKAFAKEMQRLGVSGVDFLGHARANMTTHIFENRSTVTCIITSHPFNARQHSREQYAALIAHEAVHVVQEMSKELARGESLGSEAEAYLVQQIVQESLQDAWASSKVRATEPAA